MTNMTAEEVFDSLTGFDEIAISNAFGKEVTDLAQKHPTTFVRALVYVIKRREGMTDSESKQAVMEMPLSAVQGYFPDDEEVTPEDPETESGKGAEPPN